MQCLAGSQTGCTLIRKWERCLGGNVPMTSVRELKMCRAAWRWCSDAAALSWCSHSSRPGHSLLGTVNLQAIAHQLQLSTKTGNVCAPGNLHNTASAACSQKHRTRVWPDKSSCSCDKQPDIISLRLDCCWYAAFQDMIKAELELAALTAAIALCTHAEHSCCALPLCTHAVHSRCGVSSQLG